jgi:hypothetical protein
MTFSASAGAIVPLAATPVRARMLAAVSVPMSFDFIEMFLPRDRRWV